MVATNSDRRSTWSARLNRGLIGDGDARLSVRSRVPFLWLAGLAAATLFLSDRLWTTLLAGTAALIAIAFIWTWALARGLAAERRLLYGWVSVGDRMEEEFALSNRSGLPALWVEIRDQSSLPGYRIDAARSVGTSDHVRWRHASICVRRGQYRLGPWEIVSGDPFGLFLSLIHI